MHIAFVDYKLNLTTGGGTNFEVHHLATALAQSGHKVSVITLFPGQNSYPSELPYQVFEEGDPGTTFKAFERFAAVKTLRKYERQVDVFHIMAPSLIIAGAIYRRIGGKTPVVVNLNSYTFFCSYFPRMNSECYKHCSLLDKLRHRPESTVRKTMLAPFRLAEHFTKKYVSNRIDKFVAVSQHVAEVYAMQGIDPEKIVTIPSYMNVSSFNDNSVSAKDNGWPHWQEEKAKIRILYLGRFSPEKGVDILIRAASLLKVPFEICLVGDGPDKADLVQLAEDLDVSNTLTFVGWVSENEISQYYKKADVFVHPTRLPEPFGRTIVEAMSFGVPLITSDAGAPKTIAIGASLTFKSEDHEDLARKIATLRNDSILVKELSSKGIQRAKEFDLTATLPGIVSIYNELTS